jgi:hypothetical protein
MSKAVHTIRIILLMTALVGVIRLMRYLESDEASQSSFFYTLLGSPTPPKPLKTKELPAPISEILTKEEKAKQESNESR